MLYSGLSIIIIIFILSILTLKTQTHFLLEYADSVSWYLKAERLLSPRQCASNLHMDTHDWAAYRHPCFHCFHNSICLKTAMLTNTRKRSRKWNSMGVNFRNVAYITEEGVQSENLRGIWYAGVRPHLKLKNYYMQSEGIVAYKIIIKHWLF